MIWKVIKANVWWYWIDLKHWWQMRQRRRKRDAARFKRM